MLNVSGLARTIVWVSFSNLSCALIAAYLGEVLGHVRFAINDLTAAGNQPFHELQNDIHVVVAGEIYNYKEIREELRRTAQVCSLVRATAKLFLTYM